MYTDDYDEDDDEDDDDHADDEDDAGDDCLIVGQSGKAAANGRGASSSAMGSLTSKHAGRDLCLQPKRSGSW